MSTFYVSGVNAALVGQGNVGTPTEQHTLSLAVTDYPIETGKQLSDNAYREPARVTIETWTSSVQGFLNARAADVWQIAHSMQESRALLTVTTSLFSYSNMVLVQAQTERNVRTGRDLVAFFTFREVQFATSEVEELSSAEAASLVASATASGTAANPAASRTSGVNGGTRFTSPAIFDDGGVIPASTRDDQTSFGGTVSDLSGTRVSTINQAQLRRALARRDALQNIRIAP